MAVIELLVNIIANGFQIQIQHVWKLQNMFKMSTLHANTPDEVAHHFLSRFVAGLAKRLVHSHTL